MERRSTVDELLEMLAGAESQRFIDTIVELTREEGIERAVTLLGSVQREVGTRWQNLTWSVADEHLATATVDRALAAAAFEVSMPVTALGRVVVACAEEEWHVLTARMLAEQLRARGWDVIFLGGSTPADHLGAFLSRHRPVALALSCSVPIHLPGARRSIAAGHAAGIPTIVGGAAFAGKGQWRRSIGADEWAVTIEDAHATLAAWALRPPVLAMPDDDTDQRVLSAERPFHVEAAMSALAAQFPPLADYSPWQRAKTREDFDYIVRFVEAALLTGDDDIVVDFAKWLGAILAVRGLPAGIVPLSVRCLLESVPATQLEARRLLELVATRS